MKHAHSIMLALLAVEFSYSQSTPSPGASANSAASATVANHTGDAATEVPVGPGDLLELAMYGADDYREEVRVSKSGDISLPLIGLIHVEGLSPKQTEELVERKLMEGEFYKHPQVSVFVKEYGTENVYVLGEVQRPGSYSVLNARDVLQAISLAGGATPKAGRTVSVSNPMRAHPVNIDLLGNSGAVSQEDMAVLPGDIIVVSKAGVAYVIGDVRLPTAIVMDNQNLTVLQAIAMAQGTNPTASLDSARLIRRGSTGPTEQTISLKKMLAAQSPDLKLEANDIVFVPTSQAKAFSKRSLEAIVQAATGVAMYARY